MLCEKCGKNKATTHIRSVVNGVAREKNLCSHCAAEEGVGGIGQASLTQMLASMFGDGLALDKQVSKTVCPCCGASFSDIAHHGKVGCSKCYDVFYNELLPYLKRVHGSTLHAGKIPNKAPLAPIPKEETVDDLRMLMNRLVSEERFEEAAVIRDKIKKAEEDSK